MLNISRAYRAQNTDPHILGSLARRFPPALIDSTLNANARGSELEKRDKTFARLGASTHWGKNQNKANDSRLSIPIASPICPSG
jgi:hypothetical protein